MTCQDIRSSSGDHAFLPEHVEALRLPALVLLQEHRPHQPHDRRVPGEDADHPGARSELRVIALQQVPDIGEAFRGAVLEAAVSPGAGPAAGGGRLC